LTRAAQEIWWITDRSGQAIEGVGKGEYSVKAIGSGFEFGSGNINGRCPGTTPGLLFDIIFQLVIKSSGATIQALM
jgi:hypothetical protein|tara:strand:- start:1579 stop:1806 length:228 start_codon:yes stop_codon:yes gene_type:complete